MAVGLALSGATRWGRRHRVTRNVLVALGLNLAAAAFLGAVFAAGTEAGGLAARAAGWLVPASVAAGVGLVLFRFPRSVGAPVAVLLAVAVWLAVEAVAEFSPWGPVAPSVQVQPLTDRETVTAFALRADLIELPVQLPVLPHTLYRFRRDTSTAPGQWWWSWVESRGWARSVGAALPANPLKYGVYRLEWIDSNPVWVLSRPELEPPQATKKTAGPGLP